MSGFLLAVTCAWTLCAQGVPAAGANSQQELAQEIEKLKELVATGAAPRVALENAQKRLADQHDEEVLRQTLYGKLEVEDLSPEQADAMVQAAARRVGRRREALDEAKARVEAGAASRTSVTPFIEDYDRMQRALDAANVRAQLLKEISEGARREAEFEQSSSGELPAQQPLGPMPVAEKFAGDGVFSMTHWRETVLAFEDQFGHGLPVSAKGETAFHKALGYDHRGRVDVAMDPDSAEGQWLRRYLESKRVPFFLFRGAVRGKASAAHIHIGPPSLRVKRAD
ncbi:MAG: hypothetical protein ABI972_02690 [Acidobacteriota bacterium]